MVAITSLAEVRALVNSALSDVDLQAVIDREEAWLAGRIGPLAGPRTQTYRPQLGDATLYLPRRTESVVVTDAGVALVPDVDFTFTPSAGALRRLPLPTWRGVVTVTWTPSDEATVKHTVIELVRGTLGETGRDAETIGDYSYSRGESAGRLGRAGLARSILLRRPAHSLRILSATEAT
ncbi:MAG TPA: hypothetical protein VLM76_11415 [Patescibacteria group bacterium]|nr:hypothetical protein [Patescibacteria group bacterium]